MALGFNTNVLYTGDMSATFTSDPLYIGDKKHFCFHAVYTGASSPVGTLTVEVSIDGNTWETLTDSSVAVSAAGSHMYNVDKAAYLLARIKYTFTSGSGDMTIYAALKD